MMFAGLRSLLFVPAHRHDFLAKIHLRQADAVILDLEDGLPAAEKVAGRAALSRLAGVIARQGLPVLVRPNPLTAGGDADIPAAVAAGAAALVIPKVEHPGTAIEIAALLDDVERCAGRAAGSTRLIMTIETPRGLLAAADIAASHERVAGLAFGTEDFAAALGVPPSPAVLTGPAQQIVLAAAAAGRVAFGLPGSLAGLGNPAGFARAARRAAALGFAGGLCVHPSQVPILNAAFRPSEQDVAWARGVASRARAADGAILVADQMVDAPIVARAQRILRAADDNRGPIR